jgi:hypothetical protein
MEGGGGERGAGAPGDRVEGAAKWILEMKPVIFSVHRIFI